MRTRGVGSLARSWVRLAAAVGGAGALAACHGTAGEALAADRGGAPMVGAAAAPADPVLACHAGSLPRLGEAQLPGGATALVAAAERGSVAVTWDGTAATVVDGCHLPGSYVAIPGRAGKGIFRATNRVLFLADEVGAACRRATHVVAALASDGGTGKGRAAALLVPLPCPPVAERAPAPGCLGKGLTGAARRKRASELLAAWESGKDKSDVRAPLEIYALAPDAVPGVVAVRQVDDGGLIKQARFVGGQADVDDSVDPPALRPRMPPQRSKAPVLDYRGPSVPAMNEPPFLRCFADIVDPDIQMMVIRGDK